MLYHCPVDPYSLQPIPQFLIYVYAQGARGPTHIMYYYDRYLEYIFHCLFINVKNKIRYT